MITETIQTNLQKIIETMKNMDKHDQNVKEQTVNYPTDMKPQKT